MKKKVVSLVDNRSVGGRSKRELRAVLKQIESGDVVGLNFVTVGRNGNLYTYSDNDDQVRALGAVDILRQHIINRKFIEK